MPTHTDSDTSSICRSEDCTGPAHLLAYCSENFRIVSSVFVLGSTRSPRVNTLAEFPYFRLAAQALGRYMQSAKTKRQSAKVPVLAQTVKLRVRAKQSCLCPLCGCKDVGKRGNAREAAMTRDVLAVGVETARE